MKILGLCGGSGSGKGAVGQLFSEYGIPTIDTDAVYRELTGRPGPCVDALRFEFGSHIITDSGALNRAELARIVFCGEKSSEKLKRLNEIAHRFILDETRRRLYSYEEAGVKIAVVDAPVLYESGFDSECDIVVCVVADMESRIQRIISRDGISEEAARSRIKSQLTDGELISRSDYVINNNSDIENLKREVDRVIKDIINN